MRWARRLRDLALGESATCSPEIQRELAGYHLSLQDRARRMAEHAGLAPNTTCEVELRSLAADHERLADRLGKALAERGIKVSTPALREVGAPSGPNHWARLVEDLESIRQARSDLLEAATRIGDTDPSLGELLGALSRECEAHAVRVRGLIARADPQALD